MVDAGDGDGDDPADARKKRELPKPRNVDTVVHAFTECTTAE